LSSAAGIRGQQADRYTYFVLLTAMTEVEHVITAMGAAGADDFPAQSPLGETALKGDPDRSAPVSRTCMSSCGPSGASLERLNSLLYDDARRDALTVPGQPAPAERRPRIYRRQGRTFGPRRFDRLARY